MLPVPWDVMQEVQRHDAGGKMTALRAFCVRFPLLFALCFAAAGCSNSSMPPLPEGPQTLSGTIVPLPMSLVRRGTHLLRQHDRDLYTLESLTVDLSDYVGRTVSVRGVVQSNTDPADLPVLIVSDVLSAEDVTVRWEFRFLHITADIPRTWSVRETAVLAELFRGDAESPVVRMMSDPTGTLPVDGELLLVDRRKARRIVDPLTGAQTVSIERAPGTLTVAYLPPEDPQQAAASVQEWDAFLRSLRIITGASSAATMRGTTGTGAPLPCGGTAGILCPAGFFCDITDVVATVGVCRRISAEPSTL